MNRKRRELTARMVQNGQISLTQISDKNKPQVEAWLRAHPAAEDQISDNANALVELAQLVIDTQAELEEAIIDLANVIDGMEVGADGEAVLEKDSERSDDN